jgi:hypothetical protein
MTSTTTLTAFGPAFIANTYTSGNQTDPTLARVNGDSFYVTYFDVTTGEIRQTAYDANGTPSALLGDHAISSPGLINPNSFGLQPAGQNQGKEMVYWYQADPANAGKYFVMAQVYNPDGTPDGSALQVNQTSEALDTSFKITFAPTSNYSTNNTGEIMFSWTTAGDAAVMARIFDANFNAVTPEFQVNTTTTGGVTAFGKPDGLGNGNYEVIFGANSGPSGTYQIRARVFDQNGNPVSINGSTNDFVLNTTPTGDASLPGFNRAVLGNGDSVVTWTSNDHNGSTHQTVRYILLDATGAPIGTDALVNTTVTTNAVAPLVRTLHGGGAVFVWEMFDGSGGTLTFHSRIMDSNGNWLSPTDNVIATTTDTTKIPFDVITLSDGRVVLDWQGATTGDGSGTGIGAQVFVPTVATDLVQTLSTAGTATGTSATANWLVGANSGVNTLMGGTGANYLFGGTAGNTLVAGTGANQMIGGGGNNTFLFSSGTNTSNATIAGGSLAVSGSAVAGTVNTIDLNGALNFTTAAITDINAVSFISAGAGVAAAAESMGAGEAAAAGTSTAVFTSSQFGTGMLAPNAMFTFDGSTDNTITIKDSTPGTATTIDGSQFQFSNLNTSLDALRIDLTGVTSSAIATAASNIHTTFIVGGGNETLTGSTSWNEAVFSVASSAVTITQTGDLAWTVTGSGFSDTLTNIQDLAFTDKTIALRQVSGEDLTGSGTSGVLWINPTNQTVGDWLMSNGTPTWQVVGQGSSTVNIEGVGDFNGDGTADVLWENPTNGIVGDWLMNNNQPAWQQIGQGSTTMNIAGVGDFNGDGTSDILWQNPTNNYVGIWQMQNNVPTWEAVAYGSTTMNIAGIGDFTGNGRDDILWENPTNNLVGMWAMNGSTATWSLISQGSTTMNIVGIGDFTGSGTDDVLWENPSNGLVGFWGMNNGQATSWNVVAAANTAYQVAGIGDYYGNGTDDILWRNPSTGDTGIWQMNNGQATWHDLGIASTTVNPVKG